MTIKLYIGAHKTATTHIQSLLEKNEAILIQNNIKLSTPNSLRPSWLTNFFKYCHKNTQTNIETLKQEAPKNGTWILTDENIMGTSYDFKTNEGMYPNIKKRLNCLKNLFPNAKIELFFALRSYDTFYRSTYLEVVRNRGYLPFDDYYNEQKFQNNSWIEVIKMFTDIVPQKDITLWSYEDIQILMPRVINSITGLSNAEKLISNYHTKKTRESLSAKSIQVLASLSPTLTTQESKDIIETINLQYPLSEQYPPFIAFDKKNSKKFQLKYEKDIIYIKHTYPKIKFLKS